MPKEARIFIEHLQIMDENCRPVTELKIKLHKLTRQLKKKASDTCSLSKIDEVEVGSYTGCASIRVMIAFVRPFFYKTFLLLAIAKDNTIHQHMKHL